MTGFIIRRILTVIPTLLGVTVVIFLMLAVTPGDPAELLLGERATPESLDAMRDYLGLKEPLYVQYGLFLKRVVKFDLGETIWTREKVSTEIKERFPATIELAVAAMLISSFFGIILGLISATRQYSWFDYISMVGSLVGVSMPVFWLALVLMLVFSLTLGWFPMSGRLGVETELTVITNFYLLDSLLTGNWEAFWDALRHLALPAIALSTIPLAIVARMTRSSMLEIFRQDYIKTARAKGLSEFKIVMKHALRNGLIPVITVVGLQFGILMGGAILTETVFAWPGVGKWLFDGRGQEGLHGHPGRDAACRDHVRPGQSPGRCALCHHQSPDQREVDHERDRTCQTGRGTPCRKVSPQDKKPRRPPSLFRPARKIPEEQNRRRGAHHHRGFYPGRDPRAGAHPARSERKRPLRPAQTPRLGLRRGLSRTSSGRTTWAVIC